MRKDQMEIKGSKILEEAQRLRNYLTFYKKRLNTLQEECHSKIINTIEQIGNQRDSVGDSNSIFRCVFDKNILMILENQLQVIGLMKEKEEIIAQFGEYVKKEEQKLSKSKKNLENLIQLKLKKCFIKTQKVPNKKFQFIDQMNEQCIQQFQLSTQRCGQHKRRKYLQGSSQSSSSQYASSQCKSSRSSDSNFL